MDRERTTTISSRAEVDAGDLGRSGYQLRAYRVVDLMTLRDDAHQVIHQADREEWLTVKEYAYHRKVHVQTVYSALRHRPHLFPYHFERNGRTIRIDVSRESIRDRKAS
jgi:hypothetical protein